MNLIFAGTPDFAVPTLDALAAAGHRLLAVYTQPDRPAGRGRQLTASPVKERALALGVPVYQPDKLREAEDELRAFAPDAMIVVAYGQLVPPSILAIPKYGCINVHASLLPRWRGAAPIARALAAGDAVTGVTLMQMDAGLDTGPMLAIAETPIHATDNAQSLHDRLAAMGAQNLPPVLEQLARSTLVAQTQPAQGATYAPKLKKEEALIDWARPARELHCQVRAFNPYPIAVTTFRGKSLRVWDVGAIVGDQIDNDNATVPGTIVVADKTGIQIQTGAGLLTLTRLQSDGGKPLSAGDFINGTRTQAGERFGA